MRTGRSTNRVRYECRDCGARINAAAYRASCPACGGPLRAGGGP